MTAKRSWFAACLSALLVSLPCVILPAASHAETAAEREARAVAVEAGKSLEAENYPRAADLFLKAWRLFPANSERGLLAATAFSKAQQHANAVEILAQLRSSPESSIANPANEMLATIWNDFLVDQKWQEGEAAARAAIRVAPRDPEWHMRLSDFLYRHGKFAEAEAPSREAIRLEPTNAAWHANLGLSLGRQGKLEEAVLVFREAVRLQPDNALWHKNLGFTLEKQGKLVEAEASYRDAVRLAPENPEIAYYLGEALSAQGKWAEAEAAYRAATKYAPATALVHASLATTLIKQDKWDEAEVSYRRALILDPANASYRDALTRILERKK